MTVYLNPVYRRSCPDPFVLKYCGDYWCYTTGLEQDGRAFGIHHSRDLVLWRSVAGALEPLAEATLTYPGTCYWAPEVLYDNGRFFMYYSVGDEEHMQIRVAVASDPTGPFVDSGHRLTGEQFAIDGHVFTDDGARYLFYATDYLDHPRIGTGTSVDRLLDPYTLAGQPRPVTRARYDWQVYDPRRAEKGGVRWHTLEGPFVLKHLGRYYQMVSGGNWQNASYGVGYGVTEDLETLEEWDQPCDGVRIPPILRSLPAEGVIGPGHNSVVRGPDNRELFCVYHRWDLDLKERVLAIDRLDWDGDRLLVHGPTTTPQPAPRQPTLAGFASMQFTNGRWSMRDGIAVQESVAGSAEARLTLPATSFLLEVSLRAGKGECHSERSEESPAWGNIALTLRAGQVEVLSFTLVLEKHYARTAAGTVEQVFPLPVNFEPLAYHLLRVEVENRAAQVRLDDVVIRWQGTLHLHPAQLTLSTQNVAAAFAGFALTVVEGSISQRQQA